MALFCLATISEARFLRNYVCEADIATKMSMTRPCSEGLECSVGPVSFTANNLEFTMKLCDDPAILNLACRVENSDGVTTRACPFRGTCELGPTVVNINGEVSSATFCKPRYAPPMRRRCLPGATCVFHDA